MIKKSFPSFNQVNQGSRQKDEAGEMLNNVFKVGCA